MDDGTPTFFDQIVFEANLREFAQSVGLICGLEAGGQISQEEAYQRIRDLWKKLKRSKKNLHIGAPEPDADQQDEASE
jgi:hypothetical protein